MHIIIIAVIIGTIINACVINFINYYYGDDFRILNGEIGFNINFIIGRFGIFVKFS